MMTVTAATALIGCNFLACAQTPESISNRVAVSLSISYFELFLPFIIFLVIVKVINS